MMDDLFPPQAIDRYASPQALAEVTCAPVDVCKLVFEMGGCREGVELLRSDARDMIVCEQRHAISWVARNFIGATFVQIGRALNHDHSVIVRSFDRARLLRKMDPDFCDLCDRLVASINRATVQRTAARRGRV